MPAFNALLLGPLLYWSRLVPRVLPVVGTRRHCNVASRSFSR
jgi:hypothetical protein